MADAETKVIKFCYYQLWEVYFQAHELACQKAEIDKRFW